MKKWISALLVFALVLSVFTFIPPAPEAQAGYFEWDYSPLKFNPSTDSSNTQYIGRFTVNITATAGIDSVEAGTLVFDSYQVTYVANPFTNEWANAANYHKMNIKVPVSFKGVAFTAGALATAPILFVNPWGGDAGAAAPAANTLDTSIFKRGAMERGWVLVEPGMRGNNTYAGTVTGAVAAGSGDNWNRPDVSGGSVSSNFAHYGKLPNPIVDLKAALRYLRYGTNAALIPGDKEKIISMGSSSGGCGSSMTGASGNTHEYDAELDAIGAAPGRDDVWMVAPSCPVITRQMADSSLAWMYYGANVFSSSPNPATNPLNVKYARYFEDYLADLGLEAIINGAAVPMDNYDNYIAYLWGQVKQSMITFFNRLMTSGSAGLTGVNSLPNASLRGTAAIDAYLASTKAADGTFNAPAAARNWIKVVYDDQLNPTCVVDINNTWGEYIAYVNGRNVIDPTKLFDVRTDKLAINTTNVLNANAAAAAGGATVDSSSSGRSFGARDEYTTVISDLGWEIYEENHKVTIPAAYKSMIRRQYQSVDPLYWIIGDGGACDVAPNWYIRSGGNDIAGIVPIYFNVALALEMQDKNVDAAIAWDQGHAYTNDVGGFFAFVSETLSNADDTLQFNPARDPANTQYLGRFTVAGNTSVPGELVFDFYRVTYVKNPITGITYGTGANAYDISDLFTMNIKVPVSYNGAAFSASSIADAPILMYTGYGGEANVRPALTTTVDTGGFNVKRMAMSQGWVLMEPGNRGASGAATGTVGTSSYYNPGKLPAPYVDVKSAIRYLRHNGNLIPGNPEKIFFTGSSSGGAMAAMVGATGNTREWDDYFTEIGAVMDERDDVFAVVPCCAYINRDWVDPISVWHPWGDPAELPTGADPLNTAYAQAYLDYQKALGLSVSRGGTTIPLNSHKNYVDYITPYIKDSIIKFLNHIFVNGTNNAPGAPGTFINGMNALPVATGKAAIDAYLGSSRNADGDNIPARSRAWIKPVYDNPINPTRVVDLENTDLFGDYFKYVIPNAVAGSSNGGYFCFDLTKPYGGTSDMYVWDTDVPNSIYGYGDGSGTIRGAQINSNGVSKITGVNNNFPCVAAGKRTDYAVVLSQFCWNIIGAGGVYNYAGVSQEYKDLVTLQNNSVDPMHWILGKGDAVDVAPNWFLRLGSHDNRAKDPFIFNIAAALETQGINVDAGIAWDQGHAYTQDVVEMFAFAEGALAKAAEDAKKAMIKAVENAINALPDAADIVPSNPTGIQVAYNDTALLKAVGHPASGSGANAVAATGVYALIATAKTNGGAVDGDFDAVLMAKLNAVVAKIEQISNTSVNTLDIYVVNIDNPAARPAETVDIGACTTYPNVLLIAGDGTVSVAPATLKNSSVRLANIGMGIPPDGRYAASVNAGGVVLGLTRVYEAKRAFSVAAVSGSLKLGVFMNESNYTFDSSAKVYLYKIGTSGLEVETKTVDEYIGIVAAYPGSYDWNDELNIFTDNGTPGGKVTQLFVRSDPAADLYGIGQYNSKFEIVRSTRLSNAELIDAGIPANNAYLTGEDIRSIDAGVYDPTKHGADTKDKYPVFIWLHGVTNGRSEQWIYVNTEPGNFAKPDYQAEFNNGAAYIVVPRANEHTATGNPHWMTTARSTITNNNISVYTPAVIQLINDIIVAYPNVDTDRIYICGFSAGGWMTWDTLYAAQTGDVGFKFAAAAPICTASQITAAQRAELKDVPIWLLIGKYDSLISGNNAPINEINTWITESGKDPQALDSRWRVTVFNTVMDPFGITIPQHSSWTLISANLKYPNETNGGKAPSNFMPGQEYVGGPPLDTTKQMEVYGPPRFDGPAMDWYGAIYDASDPLFELGAEPQRSSFSNNGTFLSWLTQWNNAATPITSIKIATENGPSPSMMSVARNSRIEFGVSVNDGASGAGIVWTVSDPSLAMVDANGTVTVMNKVGMAVLIATDPVSGMTSAIVLRIT
ncbi:MAG: hypothetical protein LBH28_00215 [Oscillospiraceae bacterium]|jgi:acetyl esterase/lipase|nr:hypothetical protein [Oscillospiraceae bacterium]